MAGRRNTFGHEWMAAVLLVVVVNLYCVTAEGSSYYDVVDVSVELVEGEQGVLPCMEDRRTDFAYWFRTDVEPFEFLVVLYHISGEIVRAGRGYEDGVYNISDDYSLIIEEVKPEDKGVYQCEATDQVNSITYIKEAFASVYSEGTDAAVSSDYVVTDASVELMEGEEGVLPCTVNRKAQYVKWVRSTGPSYYTLAKLHLYSTPAVRSGQGYGAGLFNITDDFSLIIKNVKLEDGVLYTCQALIQENGDLYYNSTRVFVHATSHYTEMTVPTNIVSTEPTVLPECSTEFYGVSTVLFGLCVAALFVSWFVIFFLLCRRRGCSFNRRVHLDEVGGAGHDDGNDVVFLEADEISH